MRQKKQDCEKISDEFLFHCEKSIKSVEECDEKVGYKWLIGISPKSQVLGNKMRYQNYSWIFCYHLVRGHWFAQDDALWTDVKMIVSSISL